MVLFFYTSQLNASLTLKEAITQLKKENLEIKTASIDLQTAQKDVATASGNNWGKLDFIQDFSRSNDAGNVFGFKLTSREATFGDFGFSEFNPALPASQLLQTQPHDLNYPEERNFFQSKLKYEVPLFTGFKINSYTKIMNSMLEMKTLTKKQVIDEKIYQLKKSYYDMALLKNSMKNLQTILHNIHTLEDMTKSMIAVGYAKKIDLLEVKAKEGNVQRILLQMRSQEKLLYHFISFLLNKKVSDIVLPVEKVKMPTSSTEEILRHNLDIQKAQTGLKVRQGQLGISQSAYYPTIGAFAEIATADNTFLGSAADHKSYTVGARLTWNIYNGGIRSAKLEKSQLEYLKTKTAVQLARAGVKLHIAKLKTEIASLNDEIASLDKELLLANAIYSNYEGRYKEKLVSMSDVIIKQSQQIQKILQLQEVNNKRNERIFALEKLENGEQNND